MSGKSAVRPLGLVMTVLFLAELVSSLEASMLFTAIPTIAREYGDLAQVTWLITGYTLVHACAAVLGSRLGDMYGRRRALVWVLLLCACGSLVSALSTDLVWIIAGRMLQGVTGAIMPLCFGICRDVTAPARTPFWIGVLTGAWGGSAAVGYILGGVVTDFGHWKWLFWITSVLPLVVALMVVKVVPSDTSKAGGRLDIFGAVLLVPGISLVLFAISNASRIGWLTSVTLGQVAAGLAILLVWLVVELRSESPIVDVRQLANRSILVGNLSFAFLGLGGMQLAFVLMMLIQQPVATGVGFGVGAALAGILKLPSNMITFIASPVSGFLSGRHGPRIPLMMGGLIMMLAWFGMLLVNSQLWHIVIGSMIAAVGSALVLVAVPNLIMEVTPRSRTSEATGLSIVSRSVFAAIGAQVVGVLLASGKNPGLGGHPTETAYMVTMAYMGFMSLAIFAIACVLPRNAAKNLPRADPVVGAVGKSTVSQN